MEVEPILGEAGNRTAETREAGARSAGDLILIGLVDEFFFV